MTKTILVPIADGTEELEAVAIIDVLRRAGGQVTVASVSGLEITASREVRIVADTLIANCVNKVYDLIVLPGGMPGAEHLRDSTELEMLLRTQNTAGRLYAAICASPVVVLQHHGLTDKRQVACYPSFRNKLENAAAEDERVVIDGNCITSCGPGTAVEFALKLVEVLFGKEKRETVAKGMLAN